MNTQINEWFSGIPPVTKVLFVGTAVLSLSEKFGILPLNYCYLDFNLIFKGFEVKIILNRFGEFRFQFSLFLSDISTRFLHLCFFTSSTRIPVV